MKTALLGFGTVGVGVFEMLSKAEGLEPGKVLVRAGKEDTYYKVSSLAEITNDAETKAVAEVMGGTEPAFRYACEVLRAGKHFVTSNKALVAAHGIELDALARENGVGFLFSAACGGAVPFLHNLALAAESDTILSLGGILNGTTNYMLDRMQSEGMEYAQALRAAQQLGYAEADPTADVSGLDALRKIMLACAVAWGMLPTEGLVHEGIENFTADDVRHLKSLGLTCRLIAQGEKSGQSLSAYVAPVLFPASAPECSVKLNFNMAKYLGTNSGSIVLMGQGAGRYPTASAVLRDLSDVTHGRRTMLREGCRRVSADNSLSRKNWYVRCSAAASGRFGEKSIYESGDTLRFSVQQRSASEMFALAKSIREEGGEVFFAALEE